MIMAKKEKKPMVRCINCSNAKLLQWGKDPVISSCKYRQYKDVANAPRHCSYFTKCSSQPKIIQM